MLDLLLQCLGLLRLGAQSRLRQRLDGVLRREVRVVAVSVGDACSQRVEQLAVEARLLHRAPARRLHVLGKRGGGAESMAAGRAGVERFGADVVFEVNGKAFGHSEGFAARRGQNGFSCLTQ